MEEKYKKLLTSSVILLFILNLILLLWYIFIGYKGQFHSDSAAKVMLAREIYETGTFFPKDWNYVNGDLFIIFGHLVIVPLLSIFTAGYTVHAISSFVFSLIIIYSIWLITKNIELPLWRILSILTVFLAGFSGFMAENLFGQVSYGSILLISILIIYFAMQYLNTGNRIINKWSILLTTILILAYWANPKRALISYGLPIVLSLLWVWSSSNTNISKKIYINLFFIIIISSSLGAAANKITMTYVSNVVGISNGVWLPYELIIRNIGLTFKGLYAQLGGLIMENSPLVSVNGLYGGIRLITASTLLILIPFSMLKVLKGDSEKLKLFAMYSVFSIVLTLFLQITTSIPDMGDPIQSSRYLVPGVGLCTLLVLMTPVDWRIKPPLHAILILFITLMFMSGGYFTYRASGISSQILAQPDQLKSDRLNFINFLKEKNLKYGYASYWNSSSITVLSDESIKIRPIIMQSGIPMPMKHLSSNRWYYPAAWQGETFLLLTNTDSALLDLNKLDKIGLSIKKIHTFNEFKIFIFSDNIANHIPNWDTKFLNQKSFPATDFSLKNIGRLIPEDDNLANLVAEPSDVGALHFGPYITMDPGKYLVTFHVLANFNKNGAVRLDVASAPDQKKYGELFLNESTKPQKINFELDEQQSMEFRVWALGNSSIKFKTVTVERVVD